MVDERTQIRKSPFASNSGTPSLRRSKMAAYLIALSGNSAGRMFKLVDGENVIGRGDDVDIKLGDDDVSRRHAKIVKHPEGMVEVVDLESTNGTFVNGERVKARELRDGDRLLVGPVTILKFSYQDDLEEQFQRQLYESATRDGLTGVYNRRYFVEALEKDYSHAVRHGSPLAVVLLDIDHFKKINDTHGHPAGDTVLQAVSNLIQPSVRKDDVFCRIGGEEFVILMRDTGLPGAKIFAERLRERIEKEVFKASDTEIPLTVSLGVAALDPDRHEDAHALVAEADEYLYQAKGSGRNRVASRS